MSSGKSDFEEAKESLEGEFIFLTPVLVLYEISLLLNCGLDRQTLSILVNLCENGVNPEALANVVKELKQEAGALKVR